MDKIKTKASDPADSSGQTSRFQPGCYTRIVYIITLLTIIILLISGCDFFAFPPAPTPISIDNRIAAFETSLNADDRSDLYTHFHPDETDNYDQIRDGIIFDEDSPLSIFNQPFSISADNESEGSDGRIIVEGTLEHAFTSFDVQFIMLQSDPDWYIEELILLDNSEEIWAVRRIGHGF